jgi:hypothetical protein
MKTIGCCLLLSALLAGRPLVAHAAEAVFAFEKEGPSMLDAKGQAWHAEFEKNGDYGESWFFMDRTADGGTMFAMLSITNLGLHTYDGICDVSYYSADGKTHSMHKELRRDDIVASTAKMDTKIGKNRTWVEGDTYRFKVDEAEMKLDLIYRAQVPAYQFGGGHIRFYADKSVDWGMGIMAPRAAVAGSLTVDGKTYDMAGLGYSDHSYTTIKLPTMLSRWITLRLYDPKYTFIVHDQKLGDKFGGTANRFGLLGTADSMVGASRSFTYEPVTWRKDEKSGYKMPTEFQVEFKAGGSTVRGTVKEERFLESIDVLSQVSWPVRTLIKAFYSKPYLMRYLVHYELDVTNAEGTTEHIAGLATAEANFY